MRLPSSAVTPVLRRSLGALVLVLASCAGEPTPLPPDAGSGPKFFDPANTLAPKGTLQGAVVDAYDQKPLGGAKVTINYEGASRTYTTGADGTFSFVDIPASANPNGDEAATGTYTVVLDMTGVTEGGRKYKPFRTQRVTVQFTQLTQPVTAGAVGTTTANADRNPVSYLVSNVNFSVQQARATLSGKVLSAPDLRPLETQLLLVSTGGGSVPTGATAAVATSAEADGAFSFTEVEEGVSYRLVLANQGLVLDTSSANNYAGASVYAAELGAVTNFSPVVVQARPAQDTQAPYVVSADPTDEQVLPRASANKSIAFTFSEKMNVTRPQQSVASFLRLGRRYQPDDAQPSAVPFVANWDGEGRVLTVDPVQALLPGYRYQVTLANAELKDLSGVQRSGFIPGTNPSQPDSVRVRGGADDLGFSVSADAAELVVSALAQEPDTADNVAAGTTTRAFTLESRADATERSFRNRFDSGDYQTNRTDCAYISWTAPADPVARYRVWTRAGATGAPILLSNPLNPYNVARPNPLAPSATGYDICLDDLDDVLSSDPAGLPGVGLANVTWNNGLQVDLGVSVINLDGQEGPVTWTTVKDNTAPAIASGTSLGFDSTFSAYASAVDSIRVGDNLSCLGPTPSRIMCPSTPSPYFAGQVATGFGQRMLVLELTESVDPASVIQANFKLTTGTLPTRLTVTDPNTAGGSTEPDATLSGAVALDVQNGRTKFVAVRLDNVFGLDTGDVLALRASDTAGLKDLAGNVAKDDVVSRAAMVDTATPQIKSVAHDAATESMTVVLTKRIDPVKDADPTRGNFDRTKVAFDTAYFDLTRANLQTVNHSYTVSGDSQLVFQFADLGYVRGYNSTNANCSANGGTRLRLNGVKNVDVLNSNGLAGNTNNSDTGTEAYVNLPIDPTMVHAPGAYMPGANGVGTHSSFMDTIGPRLSSDFSDRSLATAANDFTVTAGGSLIRTVSVFLTEAVETSAATDPNNWKLKLVELGNDGWTGNLGTDGAAGNVTATITAVTLQNTLTSCATPPRYQVSFRIDNTDPAASHTVGVGTVTLDPSVKDLAGNAGSTHLTYSYNPGRLDSNGATSPGWDRN